MATHDDAQTPPPSEEYDPADEEALRRVLDVAPRGALALAGLMLGLMLLAWLAVYFLVFLQRGTVG